jgi:hypothetical protein
VLLEEGSHDDSGGARSSMVNIEDDAILLPAIEATFVENEGPRNATFIDLMLSPPHKMCSEVTWH